MAAEGQSDKLVSDMEVHAKRRWGTEFLHRENNAINDIHWCLLNVYGDHSTVRRCVVHFSSGDNGSPPLVQIFTSVTRRLLLSLVRVRSYLWWLCWKTVICSWEFVLLNSIIMLFGSVVTMEINKRHYFQNNLCVCNPIPIHSMWPREAKRLDTCDKDCELGIFWNLVFNMNRRFQCPSACIR